MSSSRTSMNTGMTELINGITPHGTMGITTTSGTTATDVAPAPLSSVASL